MAELPQQNKRLIVKLVYYGPALSGKTTNLMRLHDVMDTGHCGELMSFETKGHRTLSINDNGIGVDAGDLGRLFDTFFTTREVGEGAGLGLTKRGCINSSRSRGTTPT